MCRLLSSIVVCLLPLSVFCQNLSIYRVNESVDQTTRRVIGVIKSNNLLYFETVSHDSIAAVRGVQMDPINEILFEDPRLSTELIKCQPTTALDLPLKILVWEEEGDVYLGFIDPKFMKKRFMLNNCEDLVNQVARVLIKVVVDTIKLNSSLNGG